MSYKYKRVPMMFINDIETLSEMDSEGWELITIVKWNSTLYAYFKKKV